MASSTSVLGPQRVQILTATYLCPDVISQEDGQLAVALIDGDGYVFASHYVADGRKGGQAVASILDKELTAALGRRIPILVVVYLSRAMLSEVMAYNNMLGKEPNLDQFIIGFNQASPLFSIVDVGPGKEAADSKIKGVSISVVYEACVRRIEPRDGSAWIYRNAPTLRSVSPSETNLLRRYV